MSVAGHRVHRRASALNLVVVTIVATVLAIAITAGTVDNPSMEELWKAAVAAAVLVSAAYLAWNLSPAYTVSVGLVLTPFAGNWEAMGVPSALSLDRLLLALGIGVAVLHALVNRELTLRRLRLQPVHWAMLAAVAFVTASALATETLTQSAGFFRLLQTFGILPYLLFITAPLVFRTARDRQVLLIALVTLGAYLSLTAIFETVDLNALVVPKYILDPRVGIHSDRARGPFVEAVTNGVGLFVCAVAAATACVYWRGYRQGIAGIVALLCLASTFLTLQRSVWLGTVLALLAVTLFVREARRFLVPAAAIAAAGVVLALITVPGLADRASERGGDQGTVWARQNSDTAALRMLEARPLTGFGWGQFFAESENYYRLNRDFPLTDTAVHNLFLAYGAELGLPGMTLWIAAFVFGVGGALVMRSHPAARPWRAGLLAITVCFLVVVNFVPPSVFPNTAIWLWAGIVAAVSSQARAEQRQAVAVRRAAVPAPAT